MGLQRGLPAACTGIVQETACQVYLARNRPDRGPESAGRKGNRPFPGRPGVRLRTAPLHEELVNHVRPHCSRSEKRSDDGLSPRVQA